MGRLAFLFPGQGSQYPRMLDRLLALDSKAVTRLIDEAEEACSLPLRSLISDPSPVQHSIDGGILFYGAGCFEEDQIRPACPFAYINRVLEN